MLGNAAYQTKDYEKSIKRCMVTLYNKSADCFQEEDYWRCADYCLKALLTTEDKEPFSEIALECCLMLAKAFKAVEDFKAAQEYYKKANNFQKAYGLELELLKLKADDKTVFMSEGKKEYANASNHFALMCYTKAMQIGEWGKSDAKLFLIRAEIFTMMNFFWLGLTDCKKGLLLNSNSDQLVLRRGILFHKLDIFYAALKDFQIYLSSHPNNETIKSYVKNIEESVEKKQPRFQPKLPQFFEEYREMFPNDTLEIEILHSHFTKLCCRAILIQSNPSIVDYLANKMHNNYQNEQFTIQRFGTPVLNPHFLNYWKKLPIGNVIPTIQDGGSPFTNRFQSMKNVNFPNYPLFYGKNHVSVGCVDFSELLFAQINGTEKDEYLNFAGVDCAACSIARCWILKKMIENNSNCRSILQVWFSSAWSNQTHQEFVEACEILLKESTLDQELLYFIRLWKDSYLSVTVAANRWSLAHKSRCETALYEVLANMRYKIDRAEYAKYLFTGFIFEEAESDLHCGNSTMFLVSKTNVLIQSNPSIVDYLANKMHNNYQNEQFTIQRFGTPVLNPHFLNSWKELPIGNVFPTIQDGGSPFPNRFQSMKNVNFPNYPLFYGKNHVSVGCVDFSELLFAQINGTEKDGCLNFAGVDCAVCSIARCWILKKMIENNSNCRSILQVWFSSAWSNQTHQEFVEACEILLKESTLDQELLYFIQLWKDSYLSVTEAANRWSLAHKSRCETALYEDLANMRYKIDRAEYARYLFTGFIFEEAESDLHCGNSTMFSVSKTNVQVKVEKENFYFFFNFSDNRFSYNSSLKLSMETFMLERMEKLQHLILAKQINIEFKCGQVSATNNELLEYVKSKNPHTIDWSNLMDYFTRDDFIKMSKRVAVTETVHYFHVMNWTKYVKGASILDYDLESMKKLIRISLNNFLSRHLSNRILYRNVVQVWDYQVNIFCIMNVTEEALSSKYIKNYLAYYFKDDAKYKVIGKNVQLQQSEATCFGSFKIL